MHGNLELENLELKLLLEGLYQKYGYDFRQYAPASLKRRILNAVKAEGLDSISALQDRVFHDQDSWERLLEVLTVNVSSMFRDPDLYSLIRKEVIPQLHSYPLVRIWCAGCSTGEEVYSLAILMEEEELLDKTLIYATDMQDHIVRRAREGIFPLGAMREYTRNYQSSGGKQSLSDYYTAAYGSAKMHDSLKRRIVFSRHNLTTDSSFNEFHMIFCRNTMIYFSKPLQDRVHELIYNSLVLFGVLALGKNESLQFTPHENAYRQIRNGAKIYHRIQ